MENVCIFKPLCDALNDRDKSTEILSAKAGAFNERLKELRPHLTTQIEPISVAGLIEKQAESRQAIAAIACANCSLSSKK